MPNPQKRKGSDWERQAVEILNTNIKNGTFKKIPGSGAIGTFLNEPMLTADLKGSVHGFEKEFKIECKVGYGSATQFTMKKLWLDKVRMEAETSYGIPLLLGKFSGAREGIRAFAVMDIDAFCELINKVSALQTEVDEYERRAMEHS